MSWQDVSIDYQISGMINSSFEAICDPLFLTRLGFHVKEVRFLDEDEHEHVSWSVPEPLSLLEAKGQVDRSRVQRMEFVVACEELRSDIHVWLDRGDDGDRCVVIDGMIYLERILEAASVPEIALRDLSMIVMRLASSLDALFLVVADEDDSSLRIASSPFSVPSIFGAFKKRIVEEIHSVNGIWFEHGDLDSEYVNVWVLSTDDVLAGKVAMRPAQDILRMAMINMMTKIP